MTHPSRNLSRRHKDLVCVAFLILLSLLFLYKVVFFGRILLPGDLVLLMSPWKHHAAERFPDFHKLHNPLLDVIQQYYPWRLFAAKWIPQGVLPFWNPHMFAGTSFVANGQSAIFYPLNFLFYLIPVKYAFGWTALLHLILLGVGSFGFFRLLTASRVGALVGAVTFMFSGFIVAWLEFTTFLCTAAWLPVTLYFLERAMANAECGVRSAESPRRVERLTARDFFWTNITRTGVCLGMALLAGHLQIGFYVWLAFGGYAMYRITLVLRRALTASLLVRLCGGVGLAAMIGLCVGAPQWMPVIELTRFSTRSGPFDFETIRSMALPARHLLTFLVPNFFGNQVDAPYWGPFNYIELSGSVGVVPLLLCASALLCKVRRGCIAQGTRFWLVLLALGFSVAMVTPLYWFFVWLVPGFEQLRGPARALLLIDFSIAALAAHGARQLSPANVHCARHHAFGLALVGMLSAATVVAAILVFAPVFLSDVFVGYGVRQIVIFFVFLIAGLMAVYKLCTQVQEAAHASGQHAQRNGRTVPSYQGWPRTVMLLSLPLLIVAERFITCARFNPQLDSSMVYFETDSIRFLKSDKLPYRILSLGTTFLKWMPSNAPMALGLEDIQGSDSLWTRDYAQYLKAIEPKAPHWHWENYLSQRLDDLNVKYIITPVGMVLRPPPGRLVYASDMMIYERPHPLPRCFSSDGRKVEIRRANPNHLNCRVLPATHEEVVRMRPASRVHIAPVLRWSDPFYPGWQAWVDGQPREIERVGGIFKAVSITRATQRVEFVFLPECIRFGIFLLCVAVATSAGIAIRVRKCCNDNHSPPGL